MPRAAAVGAALLVLLALAVAAFGLQFVGAIWTSDSHPVGLAIVGGFFLASAAVLIAAAVWLLRRARSADSSANRP